MRRLTAHADCGGLGSDAPGLGNERHVMNVCQGTVPIQSRTEPGTVNTTRLRGIHDTS